MAKGKLKVALKKSKTAKIKTPVVKKVKKQNVTLSGKGKTMRGLVVSAKVSKTVTVVIEHRKTHPLYGKSFRRSKKYLVHDELGVVEGDVVLISQTRPMSKNKHFLVTSVVGRNIEAIVEEQLKAEAAEEIAEVMPGEKEETNEPGELKEPEAKSKKKKEGKE